MSNEKDWSDLNPQKSQPLSDNTLAKIKSAKDLLNVNRGPNLRTAFLIPYRDLTERDRRGYVCWGGMAVPADLLNLNFLVAGVPGTGKTITIRWLLHSIFCGLSGGNRALVYDPKNEFYPILLGYGLVKDNIFILNPFDARAHAWNLAMDFTTPADALQLAEAMVPDEANSSNPFFRNSTVAILTAVLETLMHHGKGNWSLADLIKVCLSSDGIKDFIKHHHSASTITATSLLSGSHDTSLNVFSDLQSRLVPFHPIAALWEHSLSGKRSFSLKDFLKADRSAAILGSSQQFDRPLKVLNKLIVKRFSELLLDQPPIPHPSNTSVRTWVVLDELRQLGRIDGLDRLVAMGRDRQVCGVFGFQDYPALKEAMGEKYAHELVSSCRHKLFLRLCNDSAEWACKILGKQEVTRTNISYSQGMGIGLSKSLSQSKGTSDSTTSSSNFSDGQSWGRSGDSYTNSMSFNQSWGSANTKATNFSEGTNFGASLNHSTNISVNSEVRERDVVMSSEISNLPGFTEGEGISGYAVGTGNGSLPPIVYKVFTPRSECLQILKQSVDEGFIPADSHKQDLFGQL
jgi:hypothetical protein